MISKEDNLTPEWRKAWKINDSKWIKERRKAWREIKSSLVLELYDKNEIKKIKNFFMTGSAFDPELPEEEWHYENYHPDLRPVPVSYSILIETWLGAEKSEENWQHIKEKNSRDEYEYESSRHFFRQSLRNHFPEQGSLFNGLDERLYNFFGPTRCRPEDYPKEDEQGFLRIAWRTHNDLRSLVEKYLSENYNPDNIAPVVVLEWYDTVSSTYHAIGPEDDGQIYYINSMKAIVEKACVVVSKSSTYDPNQVIFAEKLLARLKEMQMPEPLNNALKPFLT